MKKSAAFTLIELLVVIVIIAILAGIALPVFGKVLEKGRVTQDCSNLRQLGIGTVAYLNDNNDTLFSAATAATATFKPPAILETNYVPNPKVFQSPFDKRPAGNGAPPNPLSYGLNAHLYDPTQANPQWDSNWTKLSSASQLILYSVSYPGGTGDPTTASSWSGTDSAGLAVPFGGGAMKTGTHQNGKFIDVLYGDMHVGSIKFVDFQNTGPASKTSTVDGTYEWEPLAYQ